jgi:Flp pilus assembly protein TadG
MVFDKPTESKPHGGASVTSFVPTRQLRQFARADEGQAIVLTTLVLVVLMLMAGLGVDVGFLRYEKQQMQKAADAGAVGGASALSYFGDWHDAGLNDAGANGFTNGVNGITVTVNNPPQTAGDSYYGNTSYVEVIVQRAVPTFFMKVLGAGFATVPVSARAVAGLVNSSDCVHVLDPTDSQSFEVSVAGALNSSCGVKVNSNNSTDAMDVSGNACVSATAISLVGGTNASQGSGTCPGVMRGVSPHPPTRVQPFNNPMALVKQPTPQSCSNPKLTHWYGGPLLATTYCGGVEIDGGTTQMSGTYIMVGGGFTVESGANVTGTNVTIFDTGTPPNYNDFVGITLSGGGTVNLSAPTSPPAEDPTLEGVLFFEDPNVPWNNQQSSITSGSSTTLSGALYFPTNYLTISGGSPITLYTQIVAYRLKISGPSIINDSSNSELLPIHDVVLAE